ncbi:MAG: type II secretion system F family protein [Verrucomicrobiae bacterium]|nr:type II secretion system F family protein [Verrucomicrobiae bacterium]MDW7980378.1 type II secretion system F family protein [Verrucomicrobiales bacterium]
MPQFAYKARRRSGELVEGLLDVTDRAAAIAQIERLGLFPVAVEPAKGGAAGPAERADTASKRAWAALLPPILRRFVERQRRPKLSELATFTRQLANLLKSGMPMTVALNSMAHLQTKGISAEVSRQLRRDVMEGYSLSDAMARQPVIFSDLYVNMVRAGEQSGALVDVLRRLADHYERFAQVEARFKSALVYPAFVAVVGIAIVIFFMVKLLPTFLTIFEGMQIQLPLMTRMLIGFSNGFMRYWWLIGLVILAAYVVFKRFQATEEGKRKLDAWKMNAPVFGRIVQLNIFGQFARTLGTLLENGVPVLTALKITEQTIPNRIVRDAIARTRQEVTDGKTIAQPLARSKIFPQLMIDLIKLGEESGDVPGALRNLADTYEDELSVALRVMTNLIEPVIIIIMAIGVGFLLLSVLSAMFAMTANIGGAMGGVR